MKINTKIRYGFRTVMEIGCPQNINGVLQKDISKRQEISEKYLDPIISALKVSGVIRNYSGKKSGYVLNRPLNEITVLDIVESFENGPVLVDCITQTSFCTRSHKCAAREYWSGLNSVLVEHMRKTTMETVVKRCLELNMPPDEVIDVLNKDEKPKIKQKKVMVKV